MTVLSIQGSLILLGLQFIIQGHVEEWKWMEVLGYFMAMVGWALNIIAAFQGV